MLFKILIYSSILYLAYKIFSFLTSGDSVKERTVKAEKTKSSGEIPQEDIIEAEFEEISNSRQSDNLR